MGLAGVWRHGSGDEVLPLTDPATGNVFAQYRVAGDADVDLALEATQSGFHAWRSRSAFDRCEVLRGAARLLRVHGQDIAAELTREQGKPLQEAAREVEQAAQMIEWNAETGRRISGESVPSRSADMRLAAFAFTQNLRTARVLSEGLRAGAVGINSVQLMQPEIPFGGVLESGFGRENGLHGLDAFLVTRSVVTVC